MRSLLAATVVSAVCFGLLLAGDVTADPDHAGLSTQDAVALEKRLTEAGCYQGEIDGQATSALDAAINACPSQDPVLRVETGMHVGTITDVAADPKCTVGVTVSPDKTIRIWRLPDGHPLKVVRLPIGPDNAGHFKAVAISPDGSTAAVGGFDAHAGRKLGNGLYLIDLAGRLPIRRIAMYLSDIFSLAYSPDGLTIGMALSPDGVRVVDAATGRELMADHAFRGELRTATKVTFGPDGSLYAGGADGIVRRYEPQQFRRVATSRPVRGDVRALAVQPNGRTIAVSYENAARIDFLDALTLRKLGTADTPSKAASMSDVYLGLAWLTDSTIVAGGRESDGQHMSVIQTFDASGRQIAAPRPVARDSVTAVKPCGSSALFGSSEPSIGLIGADGPASIFARGHLADMRLKEIGKFEVAPDGTKAYFGLGVGDKDPVLFDLASSTLSPVTAVPDGLVSANIYGVPLSAGPNVSSFYLDRHKFTFPGGNVIRCFAVRNDAAAFFMGTELGLARISRLGHLDWFQRTRDSVWGVDLARGGDLVVSAQGDGAIHWTRSTDGHDLLTLFVDVPTKRWVAWTPSGYYMASPGGEGLIGWHVNRGWTQEADFFPVSKFRDRYNRPDIVQLVLTTMDEDAAVQQANLSARRKEVTTPLITQLPPVVRIAAPATGTHVTAADITLDYVLRSPSGQPVDRIDVLLNGRPVREIGLPLHATAPGKGTTGSLNLALAQHDTDVGLIAWSGALSSEEAHIKLLWDGAPAMATKDRKLYALVVGVSTYVDTDMALQYAAKDAKDFAKALQDQKGRYYADVETRVLTDHDVTRTSMIDGLQWLVKMGTSPDDVSIVFLAGHGLTDADQTYWFFPSDANADDMLSKGVSQDEVRRSLQHLSGKVIWFLDTCHAGSAAKRPPPDINVLVNTVTSAENGGIVVFASSNGRQVSVERSEWGNGAFTKALVEGIEQGKADLLGKGLVTTSSLDTFVENRVQELTDGKQSPVMERPPEEPDFTIAKVIARH